MANAFIFDVDGVLVDSPHEQAWGEALKELMAKEWRELVPVTGYSPELYTPSVYQRHVAGRPRGDGAAALLAYFNIDDPDGARADLLCNRKQRRIQRLMNGGDFRAYDDALRFLVAAKAAGAKLAAASSSKNANTLLARLDFFGFCCRERLDYEFVTMGTTLPDLFDVNVCGRDCARGKPHPEIFVVAADALGLTPEQCVVVEDAPNGVEAAKAGGMLCIGVARNDDAQLLASAGADWVVNSLDELEPAQIMSRRAPLPAATR